MTPLKTFPDETVLVYDKGKFDDYRVSFYKDGTHLLSPTDAQFFKFVLGRNNNDESWEHIKQIAAQIDKDTEFSSVILPSSSIEEDKMYSAYAAAVISEERKKYSKLGKRIKLLGYYQVLILGYKPYEAANWSRGKKWTEINEECERYGL